MCQDLALFSVDVRQSSLRQQGDLLRKPEKGGRWRLVRSPIRLTAPEVQRKLSGRNEIGYDGLVPVHDNDSRVGCARDVAFPMVKRKPCVRDSLQYDPCPSSEGTMGIPPDRTARCVAQVQ